MCDFSACVTRRNLYTGSRPTGARDATVSVFPFDGLGTVASISSESVGCDAGHWHVNPRGRESEGPAAHPWGYSNTLGARAGGDLWPCELCSTMSDERRFDDARKTHHNCACSMHLRSRRRSAKLAPDRRTLVDLHQVLFAWNVDPPSSLKDGITTQACKLG